MKHTIQFLYVLFLAGFSLPIFGMDHWRITKQVSPFSYTAEFPMNRNGVFGGRVVRTGLLTPRYYYDLYDAEGRFQVRGITRICSLGFLFDWGTEIDLYKENQLIGMIQGQFFTSSRAKFVIYDEQGRDRFSAYLNDESPDFLILS